MPWPTNSTLSYTVLVLNTRRDENKPMTVDFNGKNHREFWVRTDSRTKMRLFHSKKFVTAKISFRLWRIHWRLSESQNWLSKSKNLILTLESVRSSDSEPRISVKTIFIFDIKEMLTTIWCLNMVKVQMSKVVVELLWWEKCGILVVGILLRDDKYESFILTGFELVYSGE